MAVLLCYNLEGEALRGWRMTAMRFRVRVRPVQPEEYGETLAALCGMEPMKGEPYAGEGFHEPMLVMAAFPPGLMQPFLMGAKRMHAPQVALKAILTDTNRAWDSVELHREISAERDALASGTKAHATASQEE